MRFPPALQHFPAILLVLSAAALASANGGTEIEYRSPRPGAVHVLANTTIIFRTTARLNRSFLTRGWTVTADGSRSGLHEGDRTLSDDGRTVIFQPRHDFLPQETVHVRIQSDPAERLPAVGRWEWTFSVRADFPRDVSAQLSSWVTGGNPAGGVASHAPGVGGAPVAVSAANDTFPSDFPKIQISINQNPSPSRILFCPILRTAPQYSYLSVLDEQFKPVYLYRKNGVLDDFEQQPNGLLTFFDAGAHAFYGMNQAYAIVDSFRTGHGYVIDGHDMRVLANGYALLMAKDQLIVDMSSVVPGGQSAATVTGLIIQEIDAAKQVVFEWRSWDHFAITDATHEDLTALHIDYAHGNSLEYDDDGNILLSSRHMDEVTKISRTTGEVIWRMGGKNNQFTFLNDTIGFSHQHDVRRMPGGTLTMFDNGNYHQPPCSRAVEYRVDEVNKTVELTWEYRNDPSIFAPATGNVQRLPNGNTLISWGQENTITEVRPDGSKTMEMSYSPEFTTYRVFRYPAQTVDIPEEEGGGQETQLLAAYPNPFNPGTTIAYVLPSRSHVTLSVFNTLGQSVRELVNGEIDAGYHETKFYGRNLASGVYFYRIQAGSFVETKRFLLVR